MNFYREIYSEILYFPNYVFVTKQFQYYISGIKVY